MKLFWKIFFTTMILSIACFSIGSYILINSGFQNALKREVSAAYSENDIISYSLKEDLINSSTTSFYFSSENNSTTEEILKEVSSSLNIYSSDSEFFFRVSNKDKKIIYDNFNKDIKNDIISNLSKSIKGHEIVNTDGKFYIHTVVPTEIGEEIFYIENFRDISEVFANTNNEYNTYIYITIAMIIIIGVVMFVTSWLLTKPIYKLSKATKQIAKGNFGERIYVNSYEEIEQLSENFNLMASNLDEMIDELKQANLRQETFIGSFAHEIKTPLTSMIGYADMLRSKKMGQEQIILSANYIFEEGKRIEALSMKLLELILLKKHNADMKSVSSSEFFEDIKGIMYPVFEKENIEFSVSIENAVIKIEPDLMKTVLINLLDNARKSIYTENGKVILTGKLIDSDYLISVEDNGKGMDESELSRITEPFYMVDKSRSRVQGGAGLGLSICAEILNLHDAKLTFKSKLSEGTCVFVKLKGVDNT